MDRFMLILRMLHILLGVFWAGTIFFLVLFLGPTFRAVGPDGAPVMRELLRRRFLDVLPVVAGLTIITGVILYWRLSGGMAAGWMRSPFGVYLTVGGVASVLAFIIGVSGVRADTLRAAGMAAALAAASDEECQGMQVEIQRLRARSAAAARWVARLLIIAVAAMAVARYV
ncbi:MAG: hypothetical protein HKM89_09215 [Gemmatimonadales bacterium]|nr:hypothetical protein [Gemmatimonadales bacterium]